METVTRRALICSQSDFTTDYRIHKMAATLRQAGYEVAFLGRSHPKRKSGGSVGSGDTHIMRLLFWRGPLFYAELNLRLFLYLLFCKRYDLVVSIDLDTLGGCLPAAKMRGMRLMFDSHEYFPEVPEIVHKPIVKWVWNRLQDLCVPHADLCVTVCQSIADIFKTKYNKEFLVVRNVPLAERAHTAPVADRPADTPFTILYQGAVNVGRGIEEALGALRYLPDCQLLIVGDGDIMEDVKAMARETGVGSRVTFTGRKPFSELSQYMAVADCGLVFMKNTCLNQYYALPNRTFDFIMAGIPIIGNNYPEIARIVKGYDVGLCIDELSAEAVRRAVETIKSNPELSKRWRSNMLRASQELTWEHETEKLKTFL